MPLSVIIVGGGIAGLSAGLALREFADVTILDKAVELRELGAAVTLPQSHTRILRGWGLDPETDLRAMPMLGYRRWNAEGEKFGEIAFDSRSAPYSAHRSDLHEALLKHATAEGKGSPCKVILGKKVTNIDTATATVTTEDGTVYSGDIVVGADGIRSAVRPFILPGRELNLRRTGQSCYRMLAPISAVQKVPALVERGFTEAFGSNISSPTRHLIVYPCRNLELQNLVCYVPDAELLEPTAQRWSQEGSKEALLKTHEPLGPIWAQLLQCGSQVGLWQLSDMDALPTWVNGRVILIGDAAHPMLPHMAAAAAQGIEDAEALGVFLRGTTRESAPAALRHAFRVRYPRATQIQAASRAGGTAATAAKQGVATDANAAMKAVAASWMYPGAETWEREHAENVLTEEKEAALLA